MQVQTALVLGNHTQRTSNEFENLSVGVPFCDVPFMAGSLHLKYSITLMLFNRAQITRSPAELDREIDVKFSSLFDEAEDSAEN